MLILNIYRYIYIYIYSVLALFSGGIWSAVPNAVMIGARAFGMFLKNQRQWLSKPLDEEDAKIFKRLLQVNWIYWAQKEHKDLSVPFSRLRRRCCLVTSLLYRFY